MISAIKDTCNLPMESQHLLYVSETKEGFIQKQERKQRKMGHWQRHLTICCNWADFCYEGY